MGRPLIPETQIHEAAEGNREKIVEKVGSLKLKDDVMYALPGSWKDHTRDRRSHKKMFSMEKKT